MTEGSSLPYFLSVFQNSNRQHTRCCAGTTHCFWALLQLDTCIWSRSGVCHEIPMGLTQTPPLKILPKAELVKDLDLRFWFCTVYRLWMSALLQWKCTTMFLHAFENWRLFTTCIWIWFYKSLSKLCKMLIIVKPFHYSLCYMFFTIFRWEVKGSATAEISFRPLLNRIK